MRPKSPELIEVELEPGLGLGPHAGSGPGGVPVWVEGALPGERVRAAVTHRGAKAWYARAEEPLRPSPARRPPACPHYGVCGGCTLRHAELAWQRSAKRARVAEALDLSLDSVAPVLPSPASDGYRALAKLVLGPGGRLGSYAPRSHRVVEMRGCPVHAPAIEAAADRVREALGGRSPPWLRYVVLRASLSAGAVAATLVVRDLKAPGLDALAGQLKFLPLSRLVAHENRAEGDAIFGAGPERLLFDRGPVIERLGPIVQDLRSGAFAQVNPQAAAALYALVTELAPPAGARVLDLYAGSGGIGLTLAAQGAAQVTAVERVEAAVRAAEAAAEAIGVQGRYRAICAPALETPLDPPADIVILNPPRRGLEEGLAARLLARPAPRIVYVSCSPKSLARDLGLLRAGYAIEAVRPVDLFPHTRHVETVLSLTRAA